MRKTYVGLFWILSTLKSFTNVYAQPLSLEEVLSVALKDSEQSKSWSLLESASESEFKSFDSSVSPVLKADASVGKNNSIGLGKKPSDVGLNQSLLGSLSLPFSTGTTLEVSALQNKNEKMDSEGNKIGAEWEAKISQAILKNGFGKSRVLQETAAESAMKIAKIGILQDRQNFINAVETAYWDLLEATKELKLFEKNIARRSELESWIKKRIGQFAAEQQDLLQIQTLLSQSKLGYMSVQDAVTSAQIRLKNLVPGLELSKDQVNSQELDMDRKQEDLVAIKGSGPFVSINALLAKRRSELAKSQSQVLEDSLRPDLSPYVSYGTSGIDKEFIPAWQETSAAKHYAARVGVSLSMNLDGGIKSEKLSSLRLKADSERIMADVYARSSKIEWQEILRRKEVLKNQLTQARSLFEIQNKKVIAERKRFAQGRTTALQMTTFELDASDSELKIYQLQSSIRKTEALARNFAHEGV